MFFIYDNVLNTCMLLTKLRHVKYENHDSKKSNSLTSFPCILIASMSHTRLVVLCDRINKTGHKSLHYVGIRNEKLTKMTTGRNWANLVSLVVRCVRSQDKGTAFYPLSGVRIKEQPFIHYPLSIIHYQLSIINYQLSIIDYRLSIIEYQVSSIEYRVLSIEYRVSSIEYQVSSIEYQLSIIHYPLSIIHYPLSIIHYPLSIIHYPASSIK
jgi:tyrosine kinase 3